MLLLASVVKMYNLYKMASVRGTRLCQRCFRERLRLWHEFFYRTVANENGYSNVASVFKNNDFDNFDGKRIPDFSSKSHLRKREM